jgi:hypothetical protein
MFEGMGDIFFEDVGVEIFAFLSLPHIPNTFATSKTMKGLAEKRLREILAVARTLNAYSPIAIKDSDLLTLRSINLSTRTHALGDTGVIAFSETIRDIGASGALASCRRLDLNHNNIGDAGHAALATAIGIGALPSLSTLCVHGNPRNAAALKEACKSRGMLCL